MIDNSAPVTPVEHPVPRRRPVSARSRGARAVAVDSATLEAPELSAEPESQPSNRFVGPARWSLIRPVSWLELVVVMLVTAGLVFVTARLDSARPAGGFTGFYTWFDQQQYLLLTHILASGRLPLESEFSYGLGYPVLGLPAQLLGFTRDPFLWPDLVMASVAVAAAYVFAARIVGRRAGLAVVALLLLATPLVELFSVPWTSTVTVVGVALCLLIATAGALTTGRAVTVGVLAGAVFAARYADVVIIVAVGLWCVAAARRGRRVRTAMAMAVPALAIAGLVAWSQAAVLGSPFITPYAFHLQPDGTSDQSFAHFDLPAIGLHFIETFITGRDGAVVVSSSPLLAISPFLLLAPVGAVLALRRSTSFRSLHVVMIAGSIALSAVYLSFVAGGGGSLIFHNYRYWMPYYPYWTTLAVLAVVSAWRRLRRRRPAAAGANPRADGS